MLIASCVGAIATRNRTYHAWLAPLSAALFAGYIVLLFAKL
jgi:hypothetical protein